MGIPRMVKCGLGLILWTGVAAGEKRPGDRADYFVKAPPGAVRLDWALEEGKGLVLREGPLVFPVSVQNRAGSSLSGSLRWTVKDDEGTVLRRSEEALVLAADTSIAVKQVYQAPGPGFYQFHCAFHSATLKKPVTLVKFVGYRPGKITSRLTREPDFDGFWEETLAQLARVDPAFKLERKAGRDSATHEVYEVSMRSLGGVRVRGWYEKPKGKGPVPALLRVPGYGQNMKPTGRADPLAYFSFNVRGHGNSTEDVPGTPYDYWIRGLDDKQGYYYRGAYADCVRAVDFLATRPEVDMARLGVTGVSQGGGLSLATAALDARIRFCAPDIPFLCDWARYFKTSTWPEMNKWVAAKPERGWEGTLRTMSYFDTLNFADRIACPVLLSLGVQDAICPPGTVFAVYNRLAGEKAFHAYPNAGHGVPASHRSLRRAWIREQVGRAETP